MTISLILDVLPQELAICRLDAGQAIPEWAQARPFLSVTRTTEELSVVCPVECVPACISAERGWQTLKVRGPLDFTLTGVIQSLLEPLADCEIPVFVISTFDTDYLMVRSEKLQAAILCLKKSGHRVVVTTTG